MKKLSAVLLVMMLTAGLQAGMVSLGSDADTWVRAGSSSVYGADPSMYLLGGTGRVGYVRFDLSALGSVAIEGAILTFTKATAPWGRSDTLTSGRFALVGLDNIANNTAQDWDEASLGSTNVGGEFAGSGAEPIDLTKVTNLDMEDGIAVTETIVNGGAVTITGDALVAFLQARINDGGLATFIAAFPGTDARGYWLATKEEANEAYRPVLEVTYVPEPATLALLALGGLALRRRR